MTRDTPEPSLCLVLDLTADAQKNVNIARTILDAMRPAALILCSSNGTPRACESTKDIVHVCSTHDIAVLIQDDADLAKDLGADGTHLTASEDPVADLRAARSTLGSDAIIGADAGPTRHAAMELGEAGATYVAFGKGEATAETPQWQAEQLTWWTELFEIPCLALDASGAEEITALKREGADLIAVCVPAGATPEEITKWVLEREAAANQHVTADEAV